MNVPLSTSNSDIHLSARWVPHGAWFKVLALGLIALVLVVFGMEWMLARNGFRPTVVDSPARWLKVREQVEATNEKALILVGASRMQLDIDIPTLSRVTGLTVAQLAIDGSTFVPILRDLAADPNVRGTVLVEYQDQMVGDLSTVDDATQYEDLWQRERGKLKIPDFAMAEAWLADYLHTHLRSYADGARPSTSLIHRILFPEAQRQYLVTLPDRSRMADYSKVEMPTFYYRRVMRNMGLTTAPKVDSWASLDKELKRRIADLPMADMPSFGENARVIGRLAATIEARGGHVIFLHMPTSGLVRNIDDQLFPRAQFWDKFVEDSGTRAVHFKDVPALGDFTCPDGSHLDYRDKARFSSILGDIVKQSVNKQRCS